MMAPVIAELYAEWLTGGPPHEIFDPLHGSTRFARRQAGAKEDFIIG